MAKTTKVAKNPAVDPTLPKIEITLDGKPHFLVFSFGALAIAQAKLREQGMNVNLLHALDFQSLDATTVVPLLFAALVTHAPEITVEEVARMITMRNLGSIFTGLLQAYEASLAEPDKDASAPPLVPAE